MIDVSDDGHVSDVVFPIHDATDFVDGKVNLVERIDNLGCMFCFPLLAPRDAKQRTG